MASPGFTAAPAQTIGMFERRNLIAAKRLLSKALKRHGRPERIVIDGSQTNREAILACDTENRLEDRSRRKLKPIRIRQRCLPEQSHRTGSSRRKAAGPTDARVQVSEQRSRDPGWDRDGSHDAQRAGEVRQQSAAIAR
jgi:transposase-like protein